MNKVICNEESGMENPIRKSVFAPAPYNISINLYVLTKTQEDAMQILEQILPVFNPDYTLSINAVPEVNIVQDMPVILNSVTAEDTYDGDFETRRFVVHTLSFTIKTNIYGPVTDQGVILTSMANVSIPGQKYTAQGTVPGADVIENWEAQF